MSRPLRSFELQKLKEYSTLLLTLAYSNWSPNTENSVSEPLDFPTSALTKIIYQVTSHLSNRSLSIKWILRCLIPSIFMKNYSILLLILSYANWSPNTGNIISKTLDFQSFLLTKNYNCYLQITSLWCLPSTSQVSINQLIYYAVVYRHLT